MPFEKHRHGRIKAGEGNLIGNAGEHYTIAELLKRGIIAAQTPRNTHAFDILATNGIKTVKIRVKTKSEQYSHWQWNIKKDGETIFLKLDKTKDFVILVNLKSAKERPDFYVIPTRTVNSWLKKDFLVWVKTPGKHGRSHDPNNKGRHLDCDKRMKFLERHSDAWEIMFK